MTFTIRAHRMRRTSLKNDLNLLCVNCISLQVLYSTIFLPNRPLNHSILYLYGTNMSSNLQTYGPESQYIYISSGGMYKGDMPEGGYKEACCAVIASYHITFFSISNCNTEVHYYTSNFNCSNYL